MALPSFSSRLYNCVGLAIFVVVSLLPLGLCFAFPAALPPLVISSLLFIGSLRYLNGDSPSYLGSGDANTAPPGFHHRGGTQLHVAVHHLTYEGAGAARTRTSGGEALLLHGLLSSHRFWRGTAEALAKHGVRCVAPDLLGFGRSPWPKGEEHYSAASQCEWLRRDAVPLCGEKVHIVGHSLGALLALNLAAQIPERISSVTLISMPLYEDVPEALGELRQQWLPYLFVKCPKVTWLLCSSLCQQRQFWSRFVVCFLSLVDVLLPIQLRVPSEVVEDFFLHSCESCRCSMIECLVQYRGHEAAATLRQHNVAMHVIHGDSDDTVPVRYAHSFARQFDATLHLIAGAGHMLPLQCCSELTNVLHRIMTK